MRYIAFVAAKVFLCTVSIIILFSCVSFSADTVDKFEEQVTGETLKEKFGFASLQYYPQVNPSKMKEHNVYTWIKYNDKDALSISLDEIPEKYALNFIYPLSVEVIERMKKATDAVVTITYSYKGNMEKFKFPVLHLQLASGSWKKINRKIRVELKPYVSGGKDIYTSAIKLSPFVLDEWVRTGGFTIYSPRQEGTLIIHDFSFKIMPDQPSIKFPSGKIIELSENKYLPVKFYSPSKFTGSSAVISIFMPNIFSCYSKEPVKIFTWAIGTNKVPEISIENFCGPYQIVWSIRTQSGGLKTVKDNFYVIKQ